jgi:hypothetical protein
VWTITLILVETSIGSVADSYFRLRARIRTRSREVVEQAVYDLAKELDMAAPEKTGALKASQKVAISDSTDRISASITYGVSYWKATDQGAKSHPIVPVNRKRLKFFWENAPDSGFYRLGGKRVSFRGPDFYQFDQVTHPGQQGTRWYSDNVNAAEWREKLERASNG